MKPVLFAAVSLCLLTPCFAQAPAMSQDTLRVPVSVDDCTRLARQALQRQGYRPDSYGSNWVYGSRDIHRALIQCHAGTDGTWADVIVASNAQETAVPASEQRVLMNTMSEILRNPRGDWDRDRDREGGRDRDHDGDRDRDRDGDHRSNWFSMTSQQPLPPNIIAGGQEPNHSAPQYVCRAQQDGNWVPGKTVTSFGTDCLIAYHETEVRKTAYDILTGDADDFFWTGPNAGRPFYTGNEGGTDLRTCRFQLYTENKDRGRHLGKEMGNKCVVSYKGVAYSSNQYEVLYHR